MQAYAGRHACALLQCDRPRAAMLLERLLPGDTLRSLQDRDKQLRIGTEIMAALPVRLTGASELPTYQDWITRAFARMRCEYDPDPQMEMLMASAQELYADIGPGDEAPVLLHGDLHHDNILRACDGQWKVIDPQGVIGPAFLECGRFLQNHVVPDDAEPDPEEVMRAITFVSDQLGESPHRIASALFVLHLLSVCWGFEMSYEPEKLRLQTRQCRILFDLLRRI